VWAGRPGTMQYVHYRRITGEESGQGFGWCVVLLKRHSSIARHPGRTCKHVRCSRLPPHYFRGSIGPIAIAHALYLGPNLLTISLSKV